MTAITKAIKVLSLTIIKGILCVTIHNVSMTATFRAVISIDLEYNIYLPMAALCMALLKLLTFLQSCVISKMTLDSNGMGQCIFNILLFYYSHEYSSLDI